MKDKGLHVLLVEDNAGDAPLLREMLSTEKPGSFELAHLLRMSEALLHLGKGGVDVVLLEMGLPDGDGFLVMERLKAIPALAVIPIIVVSARDVLANKERALKAGAKGYLQKPVDNAELLKLIRRALGEPALTTKAVVHDLGSL